MAALFCLRVRQAYSIKVMAHITGSGVRGECAVGAA